jgi:sulfur transfer complex TusBCD TusB component (DsrH family)
VRWHTPAQEYGLQTRPIFWFIRLARMTDAELALASPAEESPWGSTDDACKAKHFKARSLNRTGEGATPVAIYLSMHIIACMTRQALNQLIATMQAAQEIRFIRACASQMAGRLLCEFEAPDQDTLLRVLDKHHIAHDWIIRAELTWGEQTTASSLAPEASGSTGSQAVSTGQEAARQSQTPDAAEVHGEPSIIEQPSPSTATPSEPSEATILHILRRLRDESAWQTIRTQHDMQPVAVLLMHDAVLAPPPLDVPIYACEADVMARGITSPLPRLTYDQIVDLIFACKRVMVW